VIGSTIPPDINAESPALTPVMTVTIFRAYCFPNSATFARGSVRSERSVIQNQR